MQFKTLFSAATLAWTASGFALVDPSTNDAQVMSAIEPFIDNAEHPDESVRVRVPCNGCAVAQNKEADGMRVWDEAGDKATDLELEFKVTDDAILLGGQPIFPPGMKSSGSTAKQLGKSEGITVTDDDLHLSTHMEFSPSKPIANSPMFTTDVTLEIIGIEDKVVHVGTVAFSVLGANNAEIKVRPFMSQPQVIPTVTTLADAQCTTVICRVRAQIAAKVAAMKAAVGKVKTGCMRMMGMHGGHHGMPPHHHHDQQQEENKDTQVNVMDRLKGGPNKFSGHHGMNGKKPCPKHAFIRKLMHGITTFTRHILLPVLVGVAAGMAVSALGMVLGQLVFMIWMRLRSRTGAGYVAVYHVVGQEEDVEQGVDEEDEPLPKYEAPAGQVFPPAYTDEKKPETDN